MAARTSLVLEFLTDVKGINQGVRQVNDRLGSVGKTAKRLGGVIAGAFAVSEISAFAKEAFLLGEQMKGVRSEFERIVTGASIDQLRDAVQGTVSDLDLMKQAVTAVKLGLDSSQLPQFFEFAAKTAAATGESVQFLTDSIVKGIGRESVLIIDNLGISMKLARQEGESFGETVERIAKDLNEQMGNVALPATQRLAAAWTNLKTTIGESAQGGTISKAINLLADGIQGLAFLIEDLPRLWKIVKMEFLLATADMIDAIGEFFNAFEKTFIDLLAEAFPQFQALSAAINTQGHFLSSTSAKLREYAKDIDFSRQQSTTFQIQTDQTTQSTDNLTKSTAQLGTTMQQTGHVVTWMGTGPVPTLGIKLQNQVTTLDQLVLKLHETSGGVQKLSQDYNTLTSSTSTANTATGALSQTLIGFGVSAINMLGSIAQGGKPSGSGIGGLIGGVLGTLVGGPVGAAIGSGLGGLIGGLFGRKRNRDANNITRGQTLASNWTPYDEAVHGPIGGSRPGSVTVNVSANMIGSEEQLANEISRLLDRNTQSTNFAP